MRIDNPSVSGSITFIGGNNTISADAVSLTGSLSGSFAGEFTGEAQTAISGAASIDTSSLATTGSNTFIGNQTHSGSILPAVNDTYDLGSTNYQWRDLFLSSGSLYIDGTQIISSDANTLTFTTDAGQSIKILETGGDDITFQTDTGNIEMKGTIEVQSGKKIIDSAGTVIQFGDTLGVTGSIEVSGTVDGIDLQEMSSSLSASIAGVSTDFDDLTNKPTLLSGSAQIAADISGSTTSLSSSLASELLKNTTDTLTGDLTVTGTLTAQEFHTEFVSASILFDSGSTKFGDTQDDVHNFTGSLNITGSSTFAGTLQTNKNSAGNIVGGYFTNSQANTGAESVSLAFGLNRSGGDFVRQVKAITFGAEQQWTGTPSTVDGYLSFSTVSNETVAEKMRINSSGNVTLNSATALDFQVADFAQIKFRESGAITIDSDNDQSSRNFAIKDGSGSNLLTVLDTGRIGIGTASPGYLFNVVNDDTATWTARFTNNTNNVYLSVNDANNYGIYVSGESKNYFSNKVGIGTTAPSATFHVNGGSLTNNVAAYIGGAFVANDLYHREGGLLVISGTNTAQTSAGIAFQTRNTGNTNYWKSSILMNRGGELEFYTGGAGTGQGSERMRIKSGGDVEIQGGDIFLNSGTNYNDKGVVYFSNERTAIISDIVNATANGDTSLDFQTRKSGARASALFIDEFRRVGIGKSTSLTGNLTVYESTSTNSSSIKIERDISPVGTKHLSIGLSNQSDDNAFISTNALNGIKFFEIIGGLPATSAILQQGKLGINNSDPSSHYSNYNQLVVGNGTDDQGITIFAGSTDESSINFSDTTNTYSNNFVIAVDHDDSAESNNSSFQINFENNRYLTITKQTVGSSQIPQVRLGQFNSSSLPANLDHSMLEIGITGGMNNPGMVMYGDSQGNSNPFIGMVSESGSSITTKFLRFYNYTTLCGTIQKRYNANEVQYLTTSDYRLKEDLKPFKALDTICKVNVYNFKWKDIEEDNVNYGVLAHELQELIPEVVAGEKDEVTEEGEAELQGVDYSKLVPHLIQSIQELKAEIDKLKK